jgi:PAS domain S-box-containing protein
MENNNAECQFMKNVISNLCGIVFVIDFKSLEYTWHNGQYYDILGYEDDEIFMDTFEFADHYFHPDDRSIVRDRIDYFKDKKNNEWSGVYRIRHKKGHWVWLYCRVKVLSRDEEGNARQLLGVIIDAFENFQTINKIVIHMKERLKNGHSDHIDKLTKREIEIIYHIARGLTYTEIAEKLFISPETVNKHRKNILHKLKLNNIAALSSFASNNGLV